jgi:hypothetical protein
MTTDTLFRNAKEWRSGRSPRPRWKSGSASRLETAQLPRRRSSSAVDDQGQLRTGCWMRAPPPVRSRGRSRPRARDVHHAWRADRRCRCCCMTKRAICQQRWARRRRPLSDKTHRRRSSIGTTGLPASLLLVEHRQRGDRNGDLPIASERAPGMVSSVAGAGTSGPCPYGNWPVPHVWAPTENCPTCAD